MILGVALLLFGPGRLADIGKGLGEGIKNLKKGLNEASLEEKAPEEDKPKKVAEDDASKKPVEKTGEG